jgi:hypothetical protein
LLEKTGQYCIVDATVLPMEIFINKVDFIKGLPLPLLVSTSLKEDIL